MKQNNNPYLKFKNKINKRGEDNMLKKLFKQEKGFTMIELIIVIAIIGIIGAIIAPNFAKTTTKAKVRADVASVKEINRQLDLYAAENGNYPTGDSESKKGDTTFSGIFKALKEEGYLDKYPVPQTDGIKFEYKDTNQKVKIAPNGPSEDVKEAINALSDSDWEFINGTKETGDWATTK